MFAIAPVKVGVPKSEHVSGVVPKVYLSKAEWWSKTSVEHERSTELVPLSGSAVGSAVKRLLRCRS